MTTNMLNRCGDNLALTWAVKVHTAFGGGLNLSPGPLKSPGLVMQVESHS
jgi:hypothetical protein